RHANGDHPCDNHRTPIPMFYRCGPTDRRRTDTMKTHATFSHTRLEPLDNDDLAIAEFDREDAEANEYACEALITLRERATGTDFDDWARMLGLEPMALQKIENGQVLDQPSAALLYRAARLVGGELKIGFGQGRAAIRIGQRA